MTPPLHDWIRCQTGLDYFDLAAVMVDEMHIVDQSYQRLEATFKDHDFSRSFERAQVVLSLEIWSLENLIGFQKWLQARCCRIDRYHVIVIGQPGMAEWWKQYTSVMRMRSFYLHEVLDLPFGSETMRQNWPIESFHWFRERWYADIPSEPDLDRTLQHHCVYLPGGTGHSVETGYYKHYLACRIIDLPSTLVDLRFNLQDAETLANWVDSELGWMDQQLVDQIREIRHRLDDNVGSPVIYDTDLYLRTLPLYRNCFATVARESLMIQPWACVGEKTLRPLMLGQFVIPTTFKAVTYLEGLGFWFDRDWFDFGYELEPDPIARCHYLVESLLVLTSKSLEDCRSHLLRHRTRYQANSELARQLTRLHSE
jgi:hypothetical protein